jgi:hypothetical protein
LKSQQRIRKESSLYQTESVHVPTFSPPSDSFSSVKRLTVNLFSLTRSQKGLLLIPPLLLVTTYMIFASLANVLGSLGGYVGGFMFYWAVWCCFLPLWLIGTKHLTSLFHDPMHRFGRPYWLGALFLAGPVSLPSSLCFSHNYVDSRWIL